MLQRALILFIKNPLPGKVKTRLAATVGPERALELYLRMLEYTRNTALRTVASRLVFYSDFVDEQDDWRRPDFEKMLQRGTDLGLRMHHAIADALQHHSRAVLVGGDIPGLRPDIIEAAFDALDEVEVVIGPAEDGGYYLIGMRAPHPEIFENIHWSTPQVLAQTLERCRLADCSVRLVDTLSDVDTEADWERFTLNSSSRDFDNQGSR
jgi:rSAM/selenodomain-associated transferase 1